MSLERSDYTLELAQVRKDLQVKADKLATEKETKPGRSTAVIDGIIHRLHLPLPDRSARIQSASSRVQTQIALLDDIQSLRIRDWDSGQWSADIQFSTFYQQDPFNNRESVTLTYKRNSDPAISRGGPVHTYSYHSENKSNRTYSGIDGTHGIVSTYEWVIDAVRAARQRVAS